LSTRTQITIYTAHSPCFLSPLADFPLFPFYPLLLTWNPPSCDRIRPPQSQVACKLTSPVPTLSPNSPPSKFPEPQLPSASLRRPQVESGIFCPEHLLFHIRFRLIRKFCIRIHARNGNIHVVINGRAVRDVHVGFMTFMSVMTTMDLIKVMLLIAMVALRTVMSVM
jgi:hypothetical protein